MKTTPKMKEALVKISKGEKVPSAMIERLAARKLVRPVRERRASGVNGMVSLWFVIVGATLTRAGREEIATPVT